MTERPANPAGNDPPQKVVPQAAVSETPPLRARRGTRRGLLTWSRRLTGAIGVYGLVLTVAMPDLWTETWRRAGLGEIVERMFFPVARPPDPPAAWLAQARNGDTLAVAGLQVAYWGKPDAPYGGKVTRKAAAPVAIVVHFTDETPAATLVAYGHNPDRARGNSAFGYHFYIDRAGRVLQGAPLGVRTNHIKPSHAAARISGTKHLDGSNTIGVSLVGACRSPPLAPVTYRCNDERPSSAQIESGLAVIAALQARFRMPCAAVFGHGELQTDRKSFEGATLTARQRQRCPTSGSGT